MKRDVTQSCLALMLHDLDESNPEPTTSIRDPTSRHTWMAPVHVMNDIRYVYERQSEKNLN